MSTTHTSPTAPLQQYRIIGSHEEARDRGDGTTQAAGTCDHCSNGIRTVVDIQHVETGHRMGIGIDCAERVGLDVAGIREMMASKYAAARRERERSAEAARRAAEYAKATGLPEAATVVAYAAAAQAEYVVRNGEGELADQHIDATRQVYADFDWHAVSVGSRLGDGYHVKPIEVLQAAEAIAAFVREPFRGVTADTLGRYTRRVGALFDLDGNLVDGRWCDTQYGRSFRTADGAWLNPSKARNEATRRRNDAAKGIYQGEVLMPCSHQGYVIFDQPPVAILDNGLV